MVNETQAKVILKELGRRLEEREEELRRQRPTLPEFEHKNFSPWGKFTSGSEEVPELYPDLYAAFVETEKLLRTAERTEKLFHEGLKKFHGELEKVRRQYYAQNGAWEKARTKAIGDMRLHLSSDRYALPTEESIVTFVERLVTQTLGAKPLPPELE